MLLIFQTNSVWPFDLDFALKTEHPIIECLACADKRDDPETVLIAGISRNIQIIRNDTGVISSDAALFFISSFHNYENFVLLLEIVPLREYNKF